MRGSNESNPFVGLTYAESLAQIAAQHASRTALVFGDRRWNFHQVKKEVDLCSARFHQLGLKPGEKVALWIPNRPEFLWLWLGAAQMGLVIVVINTRLGVEEAAYQIGQSDSVAVVVPGEGAFRDFIGAVAQSRDQLPQLRHVIALDESAQPGVIDWSTPSAAALPLPAMATDPDAVALISYSSGTTALPKGALLTHCVFRKAWDIGTPVDQQPGDSLMLAIPLFGSMAMMNGVLPLWVRGGTVVTCERFEPKHFVETIQREKCNFAHLLPPMVLALTRLPDFARHQFSSIRVAYLLSNDKSMFDLVQDGLGIPGVLTGYGLTESTTVAVRNRWDDPREVRSRCQGRALPGVEIKLVTTDNETCQPDQPGEILLRGYCIMRGYYSKPEETARAIDQDGWLHTGDYGVMDGDGRLEYICRLSEGYKTNGFNVSPSEVEAAVRRHPDVEDVAVFGRNHPVAGQVGVACILPRAGARIDEMKMLEFLRPLLATYKMPRHVVVVDSFPLTAGTLKVQKAKLRAAVEPGLPSVSLADIAN